MKVLESNQGSKCSEADYLMYTHKRCNQCKEVKSVSLFYKMKTKTARGWYWACACIDCSRKKCRDYSNGNKPKRNLRLRKYRKSNPERIRVIDRRAMLRYKYGLTPERYEEMTKSQKGACSICEKKTSNLFVDHCHTNGHVRALLCQTCNTFLGWYEKKAAMIQRFQKYLDDHKKT